MYTNYFACRISICKNMQNIANNIKNIKSYLSLPSLALPAAESPSTM